MNRRDLWIQAAQNVQPEVHALVETEFKRLVELAGHGTKPLSTVGVMVLAMNAARDYFVQHPKPANNDRSIEFHELITCIKELRASYGIGLKEAKDTAQDARRQIWGF